MYFKEFVTEDSDAAHAQMASIRNQMLMIRMKKLLHAKSNIWRK